MPRESLIVILAVVLILIVVAVGGILVRFRLARTRQPANLVASRPHRTSLPERGGKRLDVPAPTARPRLATPWETPRLSAESITGGVEQTLDDLSNPLTTYTNVRRPGDTREYADGIHWKLRHGSVVKIVKIEPEFLGRVEPPLLRGKTDLGRVALPLEDS